MSKLIVNEIEKYDAGQLTITTGTNVSIGSDLTVGGALGGTLSTAAQTNITSVGTLSSLAVSGNAAFDTNILFVDAANNKVGVKTTSIDASASMEIFGDTSNYPLYINMPSLFASGYRLTRWKANNNIVLDVISPNGTDLDISNNSGYLSFGAGGSERMRILSSGGMTITNGNIAMSNGYGIDFSASAGGGATSSLLDDYEEGTWTPAVRAGGGTGSPTYPIRIGSYTKIGRQVVVQFRIEFEKNTLSGGTLQLTGFPFTSQVSLFPQGAILFDNLATALSNPLIQMGANSTVADLIQDNGSTGNHAGLSVNTYLGAGTMGLRGTITYFV
jgi:hypothetical protein